MRSEKYDRWMGVVEGGMCQYSDLPTLAVNRGTNRDKDLQRIEQKGSVVDYAIRRSFIRMAVSIQ